MKPWEVHSNNRKPADEFTIPLWAQFKPCDFYFALSISDNAVIAYIVPAEFWEKTTRIFYDSMPIVHHLPNYLEEIFEGGYEADSNISQAEVSNDLLRLGFSHNHFFQRYIDQNKIV